MYYYIYGRIYEYDQFKDTYIFPQSKIRVSMPSYILKISSIRKKNEFFLTFIWNWPFCSRISITVRKGNAPSALYFAHTNVQTPLERRRLNERRRQVPRAANKHF